MLMGTDYIFKTIRGKTYLSRRPKPSTKTETASQRSTRTKFKEATSFAKSAMEDAEKKAYYKKMAYKLKLPNAYTAALTDFMRKPVVEIETEQSTGNISIHVKKNDFNITHAEVNTHDGKMIAIEATRKTGRRYFITINKINLVNPLIVKVVDCSEHFFSFKFQV